MWLSGSASGSLQGPRVLAAKSLFLQLRLIPSIYHSIPLLILHLKGALFHQWRSPSSLRAKHMGRAAACDRILEAGTEGWSDNPVGGDFSGEGAVQVEMIDGNDKGWLPWVVYVGTENAPNKAVAAFLSWHSACLALSPTRAGKPLPATNGSAALDTLRGELTLRGNLRIVKALSLAWQGKVGTSVHASEVLCPLLRGADFAELKTGRDVWKGYFSRNSHIFASVSIGAQGASRF